jgi:hypothetical protein
MGDPNPGEVAPPTARAAARVAACARRLGERVPATARHRREPRRARLAARILHVRLA